MGYSLAATTIRAPSSMTEGNNTQYAAQRPLSGANTRDYFGSNKRSWIMNFQNLNTTDYATLNTIYQNYLTTETPVALSITETNYSPTSATVHVDLVSRQFSIPGDTYLSDCTLTLTEA